MKSGIRMIVSFLLISLVCILTMSGGAYVLYEDYSRAQIEALYWTSFCATQSRADKLLEDIDAYALQLADLSVFLSVEPAETEARDSQLAGLIQNFNDRIEIDAEATILLRGVPQYIYTGSGKMRYTDYEKRLLEIGVNPEQNKVFSRMLAARRAQLQRISGGNKLLYVAPIGNIWSAYNAAMMVLMEQSVLTDCFAQEDALSASDIYAVGTDGSLLLESAVGGGDPLTAQDLSGTLTNGIKSKLIHGVKMVIACKASDTGLLMYVSAVPEKAFYSQWYAIKSRLMAIIPAAACFAIIMSVVMGIANYLPLHKAYKRITGRPPKWRADELEQIITSFEMTQDNISKLEDRQETNLGIIRRQLLLSMINNQILGEQEFENYKKSLQLNLDQPWWCALFISTLPDEHGKSQIDRILLALENLHLPETEMIFAEPRFVRGIGMVVNFLADDPLTAVEAIALGIMQCIQGSTSGPPLVLCVGSVERKPMHISLSFYRATSALHSLQHSFENRIVFYKEAESGASFALDTTLLAEGITYGNTEVALSSLKLAMAQIENSREYRPMIRLMCSDILNTIIHHAQKHGLALDQALLYEAAEFATLEEFAQRTVRLIEHACELSDKRRIEHSRQDRMRLMAYIDDHYKRNDLSLQFLSDEMRMSMSKINLLLKENTGYSFVQYIWLLRLNETKRLLRETDHSIQSIIEMVGYIDVSSFARKFKTAEGISPGQYRQQYRKA